MPNINLAPYPYNAEEQALARRQQMAQALQQQAMQPIQMPDVPGANASWVQVLAKALQGAIAGHERGKLDTQQKALEQKMLTERAGRANEMANALIGKPPDSSVTVPMAPTQAMPVPSTLTPEDAQSQQMPGSEPYSPPMPAPQAQDGARTITAPDIQGQEKASAMRNLLAQSLASPG
jgi:hypothetical protein